MSVGRISSSIDGNGESMFEELVFCGNADRDDDRRYTITDGMSEPVD